MNHLDDGAGRDQLLNAYHWHSSECQPAWGSEGLALLVRQIRAPLYLVQHPETHLFGVSPVGELIPVQDKRSDSLPFVGVLPATYPEWLGERGFCAIHGVRFPYIAGAMARGITSVEVVVSMGLAGMMGFFGSAGLSIAHIRDAIGIIQSSLRNGEAWGCNLIHTPDSPDLEASIVETFIQSGVTRMSASAFMGITPTLAHYAYKGLYRDADGAIQRRNYVFAKISRPETAAAFMRPAPAAVLEKLAAQGALTADEVELARHLPIAEDITVEADSGGHTDGQILTALFPCVLRLRDELVSQHAYQRPIRVGAAGGLGTPAALAAAFGLGAAYVMTGSVNQACREAGTSAVVKTMLTQVKTGDVSMAPCADMFEAGVKVQVLKRRTLYAQRASRLYELYRQYDSLGAIPDKQRAQLEEQVFRQPLDSVWESTQQFFAERNPQELRKAQDKPKHQMALVFRWYLGNSSRWPIVGDEGRIVDYQVWCGPAMAAFNDWVAGSFLEPAANRTVVQVARNLLEGAAHITRAQQLRSMGLAVPQSAFDYRPQRL